MWCTTECWDCEDKTCEHYISKTDIHFKYKQLQSNWNSLREWLKEMKLSRRYDNDVERFTAYGAVLDKMNELEGKKNDK